MESKNIFTVISVVVIAACIGLGIWNYNQNKTIVGLGSSLKSVKDVALDAKHKADSALEESGKAVNTANNALGKAKTALSQSGKALAQSDSSIAKSLRALEIAKMADSLSNLANTNANEAKTGQGHDMPARMVNYSVVVALYEKAGYTEDSAMVLAEAFVKNPKQNRERFYADCGLKTDSLGAVNQASVAGIDSSMISTLVNDAVLASLPNLTKYLEKVISTSVAKEVEKQTGAGVATTGKKRGK